MPLGLLLGSDALVSAWAFKTFNVFAQPVDQGLGIVDNTGKLKGAILFQNFNGVNVELSYYGPKTVSANIVRIIAKIALEHFRAGRLTVVTSRRNKRLISGLLKLGFRIEGVMRCFYGHEDIKKNCGIRLVAFPDALSRVAYKTSAKQKNVI